MNMRDFFVDSIKTIWELAEKTTLFCESAFVTFDDNGHVSIPQSPPLGKKVPTCTYASVCFSNDNYKHAVCELAHIVHPISASYSPSHVSSSDTNSSSDSSSRCLLPTDEAEHKDARAGQREQRVCPILQAPCIYVTPLWN